MKLSRRCQGASTRMVAPIPHTSWRKTKPGGFPCASTLQLRGTPLSSYLQGLSRVCGMLAALNITGCFSKPSKGHQKAARAKADHQFGNCQIKYRLLHCPRVARPPDRRLPGCRPCCWVSRCLPKPPPIVSQRMEAIHPITY